MIVTAMLKGINIFMALSIYSQTAFEKSGNSNL